MASLLSKISGVVKKEIASGDLKNKIESATGSSVEELGEKAKDFIEEKTRSKGGLLGLVNKIVKH